MTDNERTGHHEEPADFGTLFTLTDTITDHLPGGWQSYPSRFSSRDRDVLTRTLWNTGVLARTVNTRHCPHGAVLLGPDVERLLVVPVGPDRYLVGALAPWGADPRHAYPRDPQAPPTVAVASDAAQAAEIIRTDLLPALRERIVSLDRPPLRRVDTAASSTVEPPVRIGRHPLLELAVAFIGENTPQTTLGLLADSGFESGGPGRLSLYDGDIASAYRAVQALRAAGIDVHVDLATENSLVELAIASKATPGQRTAPSVASPVRFRPPDPPSVRTHRR